MILVDTSVWIDHLRSGSAHLKHLLSEGTVLCHPFIIGELACGHLNNRKEIISLLQTLPTAPIAEHDEILQLIDSKKLFGSGMGLIDVHLLASALLARTPLWTTDVRLHRIASRINLDYRH